MYYIVILCVYLNNNHTIHWYYSATPLYINCVLCWYYFVMPLYIKLVLFSYNTVKIIVVTKILSKIVNYTQKINRFVQFSSLLPWNSKGSKDILYLSDIIVGVTSVHFLRQYTFTSNFCNKILFVVHYMEQECNYLSSYIDKTHTHTK